MGKAKFVLGLFPCVIIPALETMKTMKGLPKQNTKILMV
jgi:hypothetical protein